VPGEDDLVICPMNSADSTYINMQPQPWRIPEDSPHNILEEIKQTWIQKSEAKIEFPCRKIVFTTKSHDQGWSSDMANRGTYNGSYTWFEVGKEITTAFQDSRLPFHLSQMQLGSILEQG
jgi:hypothetical protein